MSFEPSYNGKPVKIIKDADDPVCTRISLGGNDEIGYYCVYRGDLEDVKKILYIIAESL